MSVCSIAYLCSPIFREGYNNAGDTCWHTANIDYLSRLVSEDRRVFGWFDITATGQPLLNVYQSLFYVVVVASYVLTFKIFSLLYLTKALLVLFLSLYPVSIYYCLRRFNFPHLLCGLGSLLPVTSNLGWGNNITSYFFTGTITQSVAMLLFPLALASFYDAVAHKRGIILPALLFSLVLLSHLLTNYMLYISVVLLLFLIFVHKREGHFLHYTLRACYIFGIFLLISSFWILPLDSFLRYRGYEEASKYGTFRNQKYSLTTVDFVDHFLAGDLFDGYVQEQGYFDNRSSGRPPILTLLMLAGLVACFVLAGRLEYSFFGLGFLFSMLVFVGADDANALMWLPFMREMFHVRAGAVLEFFGLCVAGIGLFHLTAIAANTVLWVCKFLGRWMPWRKLGLWLSWMDLRALVSSVLVTVFTVCLLWPLYEERAVSSRFLVDTIYPHYPALVESAKLKLDEVRTPGRLFAGYETGVTNDYLPAVIASRLELPVFMKPGWDISLPYLVIREMYENFYRTDVLENKMFYSGFMRELFNIRYVLFSRDFLSRPEFLSLKGNLSFVADVGSYSLFRFDEPSSFFMSPHVKPVLAFVSDDEWYYICLGWSKSIRSMDDKFGQAFVVRPSSAFIDDVDLNPVQFPMILLFDYKVEDAANVERKILEYVAGGGSVVYGNETNRIWNLELQSRADCQQPKFVEVVSRLEYFSSVVEAQEREFVVFSMSYAPNWVVTVDGERVETWWTTPGIVGFEVPSGRHLIEVRYEQFLLQRLGWGISAITAVILALYVVSGRVRKKCRRWASRMGDVVTGVFGGFGRCLRSWSLHSRPVSKRLKQACWLWRIIPYVLFIMFVSYVGFLYARDSWFGVPSVYEPDSSYSYNPYHVWFSANPVHLNKVDAYQFQVDTVESDFSKPVFEQNSTNSFSHYNNLLPDTAYKWRVRSVYGGYYSPWSNVLTFRTNDDPPPTWSVNTSVAGLC